MFAKILINKIKMKNKYQCYIIEVGLYFQIYLFYIIDYDDVDSSSHSSTRSSFYVFEIVFKFFVFDTVFEFGASNSNSRKS